MEALRERWIEIVPFIVAGLAAVLFLAWRRTFRRDVFDSERQHADFSFVDMAIGLAIMTVGMAVFGVLAQRLGLIATDDQAVSPIKQALLPLVGQLTTQLPVVIFILWRVSQVERGFHDLGVVPRNPTNDIIAGFTALLVALPIVLAANAIGIAAGLLMGQETPTIGHDLLKQLLENQVPLAGTIILISAVILAPIFEEFMFRGLLQSFFANIVGPGSRWVAIIATSAVFAVIHLQSVPWQVLPGLFSLSLILGWLYEKHGSLLPCIVLHGLFNTANVMMGLLVNAN